MNNEYKIIHIKIQNVNHTQKEVCLKSPSDKNINVFDASVIILFNH